MSIYWQARQARLLTVNDYGLLGELRTTVARHSTRISGRFSSKRAGAVDFRCQTASVDVRCRGNAIRAE